MTSNTIYDSPPKKRFVNLQRVEPIVKDHSSVKLYKQCPTLYFYRTVLGYKEKNDDIILVWGTCIHLFRESLEKAWITYKKDKSKYLECCKIATNIALDYWRKEGKYVAVGTDYEFMTENRLVASLLASYEHWCKEKTMGKVDVILVEQSFAIVLPDGTETCGRIDQVVRWGGRVWIRDFKTTKKNKTFYEKQLNPNDQLTRYMYAASKLTNSPVQGAMIELLYNTKTIGPEIHTLFTSRSTEQMEQWEKEQEYWTMRIDDSRNTDMYPMNESYSCQWCKYQKICATPSEGGKLNVLKSSYRFDPWDPFKYHDD